MPELKSKKIGNFRVVKYPKAIWVRSLPYGTDVKKFKTFREAEIYARKKSK